MEELSVLYVEDEPRSRRVMQMILVNRMQLSNVTIFENSVNFIERAEALDPKPEMIFLDIHVDPYDGFEMLHMLRQSIHYKDTKIVALTASVMNEEIDKLRNSGFDGCIAKPLDSDTFSDTIEAIRRGEHIWSVFI